MNTMRNREVELDEELTSREQGIVFIIGMLIFIPGTFYVGWSIAETWRMLLIPAMAQWAGIEVPALNAGLAAALAMVVRAFGSGTSLSDLNVLDTRKGVIKAFSQGLIRPVFGVFLAWLLALFIFGGR